MYRDDISAPAPVERSFLLPANILYYHLILYQGLFAGAGYQRGQQPKNKLVYPIPGLYRQEPVDVFAGRPGVAGMAGIINKKDTGHIRFSLVIAYNHSGCCGFILWAMATTRIHKTQAYWLVKTVCNRICVGRSCLHIPGYRLNLRKEYLPGTSLSHALAVCKKLDVLFCQRDHVRFKRLCRRRQ